MNAARDPNPRVSKISAISLIVSPSGNVSRRV